MLFLSTFLTVSAKSGETIFAANVDTASSKEIEPVADAAKLKLMAGNDAGWSDAETTSMAVLALNLAGTTIDETWENSNEVTVSIGNSQVPNSITWMKDYLNLPEWYRESASIEVESFSMIFLAYQATGIPLTEIDEALTALVNEQDPVSGAWNDDIYETSLTAYTLAKLKGPSDTAVADGVSYIKSQETDLFFGTVRDSSVAILALYATGHDVSGEIRTLVSHQAPSGSFGTVESTMWAVLALSLDSTGGAYTDAMEAQAWLDEQAGGTVDALDLSHILIGTGVVLTEQEEVMPPDKDGDDTYDNSTFDDDVGQAGLGAEKTTNEIFDPFAPPAERDNTEDGDTLAPPRSPDDDPTDLFSNNMLWTGIAFAVVIIIMSLATWGLIARVEEGRAFEGVRRDIFEYIKHNPGEHFAGIMHEFDMSPSSTTYHLKVLEDTEKVVAHRDNKYKRYYAAGNTLQLETQTKNYKELVGALKNITARKIVWYVMDHPGSNQKDVARALGLHPSTVNWHANRLNQGGILEKIKIGKEVTYTVPNEDSIRSTLTIIEDST